MRQRKAPKVHESADLNPIDLKTTDLEDDESLEIPESDFFLDAISPDDEGSLNLSINPKRTSLDLYIGTLPKKHQLTDAEILNLAKQKGEGITEKIRHEAENKLVEAFLGLVIKLALKYKNTNVPIMDLIQEGNIALIMAVKYYDYTKGFHFTTFAHTCISRQIAASYYQRISQLHSSNKFKKKLQKYAEFTSTYLKKNGTLPDLQSVISALGLRDSEQYGTKEYQLLLITTFSQPHVVSLEQPISAQSDLTLAEVMPAPEHNPRKEIVPDLLTSKLNALISSLEPSEIKLFKLKHEKGLTLREIAAMQKPPLTYQAIDQRLKKIYKKLQNRQALSREVLELYLESQEFD
jgi:RNA polymerase sigma factor (sigma-70 family)